MRKSRIHIQRLLGRLKAADEADPCVDGVEMGAEYGVHPCVWELLLSSVGWLGGLSGVVLLGSSVGGGYCSSIQCCWLA